MKLKPIAIVTVILMMAVATLFALSFTTGCRLAREIDAQIWEDFSTTRPADGPATDGQPQLPPDSNPPVLTLIAAGLSLGGFGGLSAWLRRVGRNGKKSSTEMTHRIEALERELSKTYDRIVALADRVAKPPPSGN